MFKIATWNVNSLKVRLPQVVDWLNQWQPDIIALQETKLRDAHFPIETIESLGYFGLFAGQPTYNGVALLSRQPGQAVMTDLPHLNDPQRRLLAATYSDNLRIINVYVPNGAEVDSNKYQYKLEWFKHLHDYVQTLLQQTSQVIVLGDFNIAPEDSDVHDPKKWIGSVMVSPTERMALKNLVSLGLQDTFRLFVQPTHSFTWWDYRGRSFQRNAGARIDLILASHVLTSRCTACVIDSTPRSWERPSDHTPVIATFDL